MKRIYVKFYGFNEAERHALDTVFRLSESHVTVYAPWTPEAPEPAQVVLIDGDSWEAVLALANPSHDVLKLVWIGPDAPEQAWRVFPSPVKWSAVVEALDQAFGPPAAVPLLAPADLDLHAHDLDVQLDAMDDTEPMPLTPGTASPGRRVLVVDAGRDERLYLRTLLAAAGIYEVDEAASGAEALVLLGSHHYQLVTVDLGLADMDSWQLIRAVDSTRPAIPHLFVTGTALAWHQGLRARFAGAQVLLKKPLDPGRLQNLLQNI